MSPAAHFNNVTAPDEYEPGKTLSCPGTTRVRIRVANQAIYWQRGHSLPGGGGIQWQDEEFLTPCADSIEEPCEAIRIRAAVKAAALPPTAKPAQVTITTR
jgi:hypothetical protein